MYIDLLKSLVKNDAMKGYLVKTLVEKIRRNKNGKEDTRCNV